MDRTGELHVKLIKPGSKVKGCLFSLVCENQTHKLNVYRDTNMIIYIYPHTYIHIHSERTKLVRLSEGTADYRSLERERKC
jgi:hypothetical protein